MSRRRSERSRCREDLEPSAPASDWFSIPPCSASRPMPPRWTDVPQLFDMISTESQTCCVYRQIKFVQTLSIATLSEMVRFGKRIHFRKNLQCFVSSKNLWTERCGCKRKKNKCKQNDAPIGHINTSFWFALANNSFSFLNSILPFVSLSNPRICTSQFTSLIVLVFVGNKFESDFVHQSNKRRRLT